MHAVIDMRLVFFITYLLDISFIVQHTHPCLRTFGCQINSNLEVGNHAE